jgi:hypothetical protein
MACQAGKCVKTAPADCPAQHHRLQGPFDVEHGLAVSIVAMLDIDDLLVPSLACKGLHRAVRRSNPAGLVSSARAVCSSLKRFLWIKEDYPGEKPAWLTAAKWAGWMDEDDLEFGSTHWVVTRLGSLPVMQWAYEQGCPFGPDFCPTAAGRGHLEMLRWGYDELGFELDPWIFRGPAQCGHIEVLKFLRDHGCDFPQYDLLACAAMGGQIEVLEWCLENGCVPHVDHCAHAASYGRFQALVWMRSKGLPWNQLHCLRHAVQHRHWETARCIAAAVAVCDGDTLGGKPARRGGLREVLPGIVSTLVNKLDRVLGQPAAANQHWPSRTPAAGG